jgi:hypothetical protein
MTETGMRINRVAFNIGPIVMMGHVVAKDFGVPDDIGVIFVASGTLLVLIPYCVAVATCAGPLHMASSALVLAGNDRARPVTGLVAFVYLAFIAFFGDLTGWSMKQIAFLGIFISMFCHVAIGSYFEYWEARNEAAFEARASS